MTGLFITLILLGLSSIDPIGIAVMPILLLQKKPFKRSFIFLLGSLISIIILGILFARGLGLLVINFENSNHWFVPTIEIVGGLLLLIIAGSILWRIRKGNVSMEPPDSIVKRLTLSDWQLFIIGITIVAAQSTIDVVFLVAMVRVGRFNLSNIDMFLAVTAYAIAALFLQLAVVAAYKLTPVRQRNKTLDKVHYYLLRYANQTMFIVSFFLGSALLFIGTHQ
jgi:hypothetical protein